MDVDVLIDLLVFNRGFETFSFASSLSIFSSEFPYRCPLLLRLHRPRRAFFIFVEPVLWISFHFTSFQLQFTFCLLRVRCRRRPLPFLPFLQLSQPPFFPRTFFFSRLSLYGEAKSGSSSSFVSTSKLLFRLFFFFFFFFSLLFLLLHILHS